MKRIAAISLLFLFCGYAFTFKTRYCFNNEPHDGVHSFCDKKGNIQYCYYHKENTRFRGDSKWHIKEVAKKRKLADENFFPNHYYCLNIIKNALPYETKILPLKNYSTDALIAPPVIKIPVPEFSSRDWNIPEIRCRGSSPPLVISLRAPPLS